MNKSILIPIIGIAVLFVSGCRPDGRDFPGQERQINLEGGSGRSGGSGGVLSIGVVDGGVEIGGKAPRPAITAAGVNLRPEFGPTPALFTEDTVIPVLGEGDVEPEAGTYYLQYNRSALFRSDGDGNLTTHEIASGLDLQSGVRLTLGLNVPGEGGAAESSVAFDNDVRIGGILTVPLRTDGSDGLDRGALTLRADRFMLTESGTIDLRGETAEVGSEAAGGWGGTLDLVARNDMILLGLVDASGAGGDSGMDGGRGGRLSFGSEDKTLYVDRRAVVRARGGDTRTEAVDPDASYYAGNGGIILFSGNALHIRGRIESSGGTAGAKGSGRGGWGGFVSMEGRVLYNDAIIESRGGDGAVSGGGGGRIMLKSSDSFSGADGPGIFSGGTIDIRGGASDDGGFGGIGGAVWLIGISQTRGCRLDGTILASGGDAIDAEDLNGSGGAGGYIAMFCDENSTQNGPAVLSASIDLHGGAGTLEGGRGGQFEVRASFVNTDAPDEAIYLAGYRKLTLSGGAGSLSGGAGGMLYISIDPQEQEANFSNRADLVARGGDARMRAGAEENASGQGGDGGLLRFDFSGEMFGRGDNSGDLDFSGGDSYGEVNNSRGGVGEICLDEPTDFNNTGRSDFRRGEGGIPGTGEDGSLTVGDRCGY